MERAEVSPNGEVLRCRCYFSSVGRSAFHLVKYQQRLSDNFFALKVKRRTARPIDAVARAFILENSLSLLPHRLSSSP